MSYSPYYSRSMLALKTSLTIPLTLALTSCGASQQAGASNTSAALSFSSHDLFAEIAGWPKDAAAAVFTQVNRLSFAEYYQMLLDHTSNAAVTVDDVPFLNSHNYVMADRAAILALGDTYQNIGQWRAAMGDTALVPTEQGFAPDFAALQAASKQGLSLTAGMVGSSCPSDPGQRFVPIPDSTNVRANNAVSNTRWNLRFLRVDVPNLGVALNKHAMSIKELQSQGQRNVPVVTPDKFSSPDLLIYGNSDSYSPTRIQVLNSYRGPAGDTTKPVYVTDMVGRCMQLEPGDPSELVPE